MQTAHRLKEIFVINYCNLGYLKYWYNITKIFQPHKNMERRAGQNFLR